MKILTFAAVAALMPVAALAHDGMHINDAYARSTNPKVGAVFMTLENHRAVECTLEAIATDAAERAELHTHQDEGGIMKMVKMEDGITVPPGEAHQMNRGGEHVMLLGLAQPLKDGDTVALTLDFGDCGTESAEAVVDNQREGDAGQQDQHHHGEGEHAGH
ncbi:copper chaperone PCu(A)C [Paracoccus sp. (in: a-proteobacteria)]|uniref:copper chaperone PCu(A)C n=1 Tax=Paracoccus sp. TaxID=267 RepID=UPI00396CE8D8